MIFVAAPTCALLGAETVVVVLTGEIVTAPGLAGIIVQLANVNVAAPGAVGVQEKVTFDCDPAGVMVPSTDEYWEPLMTGTKVQVF